MSPKPDVFESVGQGMRERLAMARPRQLKLAAFMRPASIHTGAWRYPGAFPDGNFNFAHLKRFAQTLERGNKSEVVEHSRA